MADGDWDIVGRIPMRDFLAINSSCTAVTHIYRDMLPFDTCEQFGIMRDAISAGSFQDGWITRGCKTTDEIVFYFNKLNILHRDMRCRGFKTQKELGVPLGEEINVAVDRNGEFHKQEGEGNHRLAMASLLKIERVPVVVRRVHAAWVREQMREYRSDMLTAINLGFAGVVQAHPERDARG
ncbi:hypothetical protein [Bradyrhizobium sp. LTSP857]|uniref:hypothetical protein n=1 Tax=Bradyrhizobium sp. LTSP857 TaxID=1619231 RepID=UPI0012E024D4|nr:hypothetical protein [Bradyrhizobium sp. LTSP857]